MSRQPQDLADSITNAIDDGLIVIEKDYTISFANRAYAAQVGVALDDIPGQKCYRISHGREDPCLPPEHECPLRKVLQTRRAQKAIHRHLNRSGSPVWVEVSCSPMSDRSGKVVRAVEVTRDITERKRLEREFSRAEQLANLGQMAATIAHQVRNPLAGMRGALEVIRSKTLDRAHVDALDQVIEQVDRIADTTQFLLDFARPTDPRRVPLNLNSLIEKVCSIISEQAKSQGNEIILDLEHNPRQMFLDPGLTLQAVLNIALNALQEMNKGGMLGIRTRWLSAEGIAKISFIDTGYGMTREILSKVFTPFFTTRHFGTGLGLCVVKNIVEDQEGTVSINSVLGLGTTVVVTFPQPDKQISIAQPEDSQS